MSTIGFLGEFYTHYGTFKVVKKGLFTTIAVALRPLSIYECFFAVETTCQVLPP